MAEANGMRHGHLMQRDSQAHSMGCVGRLSAVAARGHDICDREGEALDHLKTVCAMVQAIL